MAASALQTAVRRLRTQLAADRHGGLSDRQLLERFLHQHDEEAFTALVRRHERLVHAALAKVLTNPADVEDAFQATFLVLVRKAKSVKWQAGLGTWLYAVAHRVAVHARAALRKRVRREEEAAERAATADALPDLSWREACALLHEELDRLPDKFRLPVLLCYLEGKSRDEAAAQLGLTPATIKGRLERGRDRLRDRLTRRGVALSAGLLGALAHSSARAFSPRLVETTLTAAAGAVPARVAVLVQGVTTLMTLSKMKFLAGMLLIAGLVGTLLGVLPLAPQAVSSPSAAVPAERNLPAAENNDDAKDVELAGRVLDPAGKPLAGAKVYVWADGMRKRDERIAGGTTGADGGFRFRLDRAQVARNARVLATAQGFGPDWVELRSATPNDLTLRLPKDDIPVEGRVLDLEGRPIAGATAEVRGLAKPADGDLKAFLAAWKDPPRFGMPNLPPMPWLAPAALDGPTTATTDKDGRFRLTGFGRERKVDLTVHGPGTQRMMFTALTRTDRDATVPNQGIHPASFDLVLGPGKVIEGIVTEKGTGKPVAGVRVQGATSQAVTDDQGRYRLEGVGKRERYFVNAVGGATHFTQMAKQVADSPGLEPVRVDFELDRGMELRGQLRDQATGKPVSGLVQYYAKSDNPNLKNYTADGLATRAGAGPDGTFRILAIPGPGYLVVQADENRYSRAVVERWDGNALETAPHHLFPNYYHAILPVSPGEKEAENPRYEIQLVSGLTKSGTVVGPDEQPLTDVIAFGLTAIPDPGARTFPRPTRFGEPPPERLKTAAFTAVGLNPKEPRHLVFIHPEKKLGKVHRIRGDEAGDLVVKLEPLGATTGQVRQGDSTPAAEPTITPWPARRFAFYKDYPIELLHHSHDPTRSGRLIRWLPDPVTADSAGKFRLEGLVPGLKYELLVTDGPFGQGTIPTHYHDNVTVEAGKTRDLGALKSR